MFTQQQFAALADYDLQANPEGLDLKKHTPVKEFTLVDFSDNALYYRTADGQLQCVERSLVKNWKRVGVGDKIVLNGSMDVISVGSKSLDDLASVSSKTRGRAATSGSNEMKKSSLF